ncbi:MULTISPECIES: YadA-like family protein [Acinetobacter]|uniref:Trimeric autotransporter adhesin YadA-like C-terminal membrane anchor domain-containing protein n=2 Tax=Bacteria TaxID=2 RepID=A0ABX9TX62_9GAMM|nr:MULTISPECIES: YadA C-terminal domain-containing protein [Acinetobacter]MBI1450830.1 YadA C-terminal domain-containing protein [Acinetobacter sp. FL51]RKG42646.1 hypothetical protein D7V31_06610 [Acinetobacter sp. WCHAc060007]RLL22724.1 hypothetical protein D9K81_05835 [Acinetobacter chengduensis]
MKFQKTLLAATMAIIASHTVNAADVTLSDSTGPLGSWTTNDTKVNVDVKNGLVNINAELSDIKTNGSATISEDLLIPTIDNSFNGTGGQTVLDYNYSSSIAADEVKQTQKVTADLIQLTQSSSSGKYTTSEVRQSEVTYDANGEYVGSLALGLKPNTSATTKYEANKNNGTHTISVGKLEKNDEHYSFQVTQSKDNVNKSTTITAGNIDLGSGTSSQKVATGDWKKGQAYAIYEVTQNGKTSKVETFDGKLADGTAFNVDNPDYSQVTLVSVGAGGTQAVTVSQSEVVKKVTDSNVTYGEKTTQQKGTNVVGDLYDVDAAGKKIAGTDKALDQTFVVSGQGTVVNEQSVVTGIIGQDADNNNVYGVVASNITTDATTGTKTEQTSELTGKGLVVSNGTNQTSISADGISTTGDLTIFAGSDKETTVGSFVQATTAKVETQVNEKLALVDTKVEAIDTKVGTIDAKVVEVDSRLTAQVGQLGGRVDQLNKRIDDVEKTSYRGIAIALAAQQQIPNIGAGQFAVFGGAGHYEGESAAALGVASVLADGRTAFSAALGFAGGNEVGGRVGVSYVFGGK